MKKVLTVLAVAVALLFTLSSCQKNPKSVLESVADTAWTGTKYDSEYQCTYEYVYEFSATALEISVTVYGQTQHISATYTYKNPVVTYTATGNTGDAVVSADGKTLKVNNDFTLTRATTD